MAASKLLSAKGSLYDPNAPYTTDVTGFSDAEIMANAKKMPRKKITQTGAKLTGSATDPALAAGGNPFDILSKSIQGSLDRAKGK